MNRQNSLFENIEKLHTTKLGIERIRNNLLLQTDDVVQWCKYKMLESCAVITKQGKNYYIKVEQYVITINATSYTIITAHLSKL